MWFGGVGADFGDAADGYPVLLADDGARHTGEGPTLGTARDEEADGVESANADGDDLAGTDDEDGVTFGGAIVVSTASAGTGSVDVNLQNADGTSNRLDAWIDWNRDGDWGDSGEQILTDFDLGTTNGMQAINFTIPQKVGDNVVVGTSFARFRLSTAGNLAVTGAATDGEVEDYAVTISTDATPPVLNSFTRQSPNAARTNADSLVFRVTFNEGVTGVDSADFTVTTTSTASITNVTEVSADVYDVTVSGGDLADFDGTVELNLSGSQNITDLAGNALPNGEPTTDEEYTVDNVIPASVSFVRRNPATSQTSADTVVFRVTFTEPILAVGVSHFELLTSSAASVSNVNEVSADVYDVTVSGGDLANFNGTIELDFVDGQNIVDLAGNSTPGGKPNTGAGAPFADEIYTIDNTAPGVTSIVRQNPMEARTNADSLVWRVTFTENVTGVDAADFTLVTTSTTSISNVNEVTADVYDVTVSGGDLADFDGTVDLRFSGSQNIVDLAGLALSVSDPTTETYTVDNTAPGIASFIRHNPLGTRTAADSLVFRATFSEDVTAVDDADFTLITTSNATIANVVEVSGSVYDVTVSGGDLADFDGTVELDLAGSQNIIDLAGNALPVGDPSTDEIYTVDNTSPVVLSIRRQNPLGERTAANSVVFRVTFSEGVTGVDSADFALTTSSTATVSSVNEVSPNVHDVTVSGGDLANFSGDLQLTLAGANDIEDLAGLALAGGDPTTEKYIFDNIAPTAVSFERLTPSVPYTNADSLVFQATFSEDVLNVDVADFAVDSSSTAGVTDVSTVSTSVYNVTVSGGNLTDFDGRLGLDLSGSQNITDLVGLPLIATEPSTDDEFLVDNTRPAVLSILRQTPIEAQTAADESVFRVTFSDFITRLDMADFEVDTTSTADVTDLAEVSADVYDVTISGGDLATFNGTVRLNVSNVQDVTDLAGNPLSVGDPTTEIFTVDNLRPTVRSIVRADSNPTNANSVNFAVTFNESVSGIGDADFVLVKTGTAVGTINSVSAATGSSVTVTIVNVDGNGTLGLNFDADADGGVIDAAGNVSDSDFAGETYTLDNILPAVQSIVAVNSSPTNADSVDYTVTFDGPVNGVDSGDFAVTVGGDVTAEVASVSSSSGTAFTVTVDSISGDGTLRLDFDASVSGGVTDSAGNVSLSDFSAGSEYLIDNTAPAADIVDVSPDPRTSNAGGVVVNFSEDVTGVDGGDFSLTRSGQSVDLTGLIVTGSDDSRTLNLAAFTDTAGDYVLRLIASGSGIQDAAGNPLVSDASDSWRLTGGIDVEVDGLAEVTEVGSSFDFTVVLTVRPATDVTVTLTSFDETEATVSPSNITFTSANWDSPQTVTVTGEDDPDDDNNQTSTVTIRVDDATSDDAYDGLSGDSITVTTLDDDEPAAPGFTVVESDGTTIVDETGGTDTFTVRLDAVPQTNVVLDITSDDPGEAEVSPIQLTFTAANWHIEQVVTVTGQPDDEIADGDQDVTVTVSVNASSHLDFRSLAPQSVGVTNRSHSDPQFFTLSGVGRVEDYIDVVGDPALDVELRRDDGTLVSPGLESDGSGNSRVSFAGLPAGTYEILFTVVPESVTPNDGFGTRTGFLEVAAVDLDANGTFQFATDGILLLAYSFGTRGAGLDVFRGPGASRDGVEVAGVIGKLADATDLDGDGRFVFANDGILLLAHSFGARGTGLESYRGANATRSGDAIAARIDELQLRETAPRIQSPDHSSKGVWRGEVVGFVSPIIASDVDRSARPDSIPVVHALTDAKRMSKVLPASLGSTESSWLSTEDTTLERGEVSGEPGVPDDGFPTNQLDDFYAKPGVLTELMFEEALGE